MDRLVEQKNGQKNFLELLLKAVSPYFEKVEEAVGKKESADWNRRYINYLFDNQPPPEPLIKEPPTVRQNFLFGIFYAFIEITNAYDTLIFTEKFLKFYPSGRQHISKKDYIQYHFETYVHNSYVLRNRLLDFTMKVLFEKHQLLEEQKAVQLKKLIADFFDTKVSALRVTHVHKSQKIELTPVKRLGELSLISMGLSSYGKNLNDRKMYSDHISKQNKIVLQQTYDFVSATNKETETFINDYFEKILMLPKIKESLSTGSKGSA